VFTMCALDTGEVPGVFIFGMQKILVREISFVMDSCHDG
jgi:hypothetical protein